ncbi:MAG TPA: hypothetical protein VGI17_09075 [Solirubrobacterales bacterium]
MALPAVALAAAQIEGEYAAGRIDSAVLEAEINPQGEPTSCEAQYVVASQFQASGYAAATTVPCAPASLGEGTSTVLATASIQGLGFDTIYHYRFLADGVGGDDQTFSTFGIEAFSFEALSEDGEAATRAGSHPDELTTSVTLSHADVRGSNGGGALVMPAGVTKDVVTELPAGIAGSAISVPQCPSRLAEAQQCSPESQVGFLWVSHGGTVEEGPAPLYSITPPRGTAARFLAVINLSTAAFIDASVRSDGDYGITAGATNISGFANVYAVKVEMWGVPASPTHDPERFCTASANVLGCASNAPEAPLLSMPTTCAGPLSVTAGADAYGRPGEFAHRTVEMPAVTGCNALQFEPSFEARPTTNVADSPTGLHVDLHVPQPPSPFPSQTPKLSCDTGSWSGAPNEFSFQWLRNGTPIPGAEEPSYRQTAADAGTLLQCEVEADNAAIAPGFSASQAIPVRPIPSPPPALPPSEEAVIVSGTVDASGGTLTCTTSTWDNKFGPEAAFAFRWFENGVETPEDPETPEEIHEREVFGLPKTKSKLTVAAGEAPSSIQCEVFAGKSGDTAVAFSEVVESEPALDPALPSPLVAPHVTMPENGPALATADLRDAVVKLPPGLTVNASSAAGLAGCTPAQFGLTTPVGTSPIHATDAPAQCPDASKIGSVEVDTPLLAHPLPGGVFLARPYENPFESLLAIYVGVYDPISGVVIKLAGHVELGPEGQLTTTFDENPQLPFEDFKLDFFNGPRGALKTPAICGNYESTSTLTPWSAPETGPPATPRDTYAVSQAPDGGACPTSQGARPNSPTFSAGTESPLAGAYSPLVLNLRREDGSQNFESLTVSLPPGMIGKLAGIRYCPDSALAAAASKSGAEERAAASCPAASEVGSVDVGAGAGPAPFHVGGHAYLAGPYKGAPLSLAIVTPAVAGPFDLGTVVVRSALEVNPETTQITAKSDPIPTELKGIPLDVRSIAVRMDRPSFTLNPTNCEAKSVSGTLTSSLGNTAPLLNRFQVGECRRLKFEPKVSLSLKGATKRTGHPALKAVVTYPKKGAYANVAGAQVNLPHSEFLDQGSLNNTCTKPVLAAGACPASTVYGKAKAWTPLLDKPLEGNVYLVGGYGYKLPALVAELNGQIRVLLVGKVDTGKNKGIRNTFEAVPDAPVEKFVLEMKGGPKYGLLENSENLCKSPQRLAAKFTAQNGLVDELHPLVANGCKKAKKGHKKGKKGSGHGHRRKG